MHLVFFGLSLSSSWGNGHATTYRALLRGLRRRGHRVDFFERDAPWYAAHRDLRHPREARLRLYAEWNAVRGEALAVARGADAVIVGSYFPDSIPLLDDLLAAPHPLLAFYDIDTPVTLETLAQGRCAYLRRDHIPRVDLYFSFTGGPVLDELRRRWGAARVAPLYCACDPADYPERNARRPPSGLLNYMGTFAPDRQSKLQRLLLEPARRLPQARFHVAGSMYPDSASWPSNVAYTPHLPPERHAAFYADSWFTLNLTRQAMVEAGFSPSIRLFEAACTATAIISDPWPGLEQFFAPGKEILIAEDTAGMVELLRSVTPDQARTIGRAARARTLREHTGDHRAAQLEACLRPGLISPVHASHENGNAPALASASSQLMNERRG